MRKERRHSFFYNGLQMLAKTGIYTSKHFGSPLKRQMSSKIFDKLKWFSTLINYNRLG